MSDQIIEATAIDEPAGELVIRPRRSEVLRPLDVAEQRAAMEVYQRGLREILDESDWQTAGDTRFVKRSGWRKIAAWFDLSIELIRDDVDRDEDGSITRASVWARAVAPSGRFADGDGYCDVHETRFYKASARQKLENDLRGTATTRAVNRAISNLVGMGAVRDAEEIAANDGPAHGPDARSDDELWTATGAACVKLAGDPRAGARLFADIRGRLGGYMPQAAAIALTAAARAIINKTGDASS